MASSIRRSTLTKFLFVVACAIVPSITWAQHGPVRAVGGGSHVSAPPVSRAPMYHGPAYSAPFLAPRPSAGVPSAAFGAGFHSWGRPIRPFPRLIIIYYPLAVGPAPFWQFNSCWWASCDLFWTLGTVTLPSYQYSPPNYVLAPQYEPPVYGEVSSEMPQLYLKDGSILSVTDYWVINGQLHFRMIEAEGANPVEHDIPFDQLDLQKTIDANSARGFKFMLRNEPFDQYVRDHPDTPPASATPPHE